MSGCNQGSSGGGGTWGRQEEQNSPLTHTSSATGQVRELRNGIIEEFPQARKLIDHWVLTQEIFMTQMLSWAGSLGTGAEAVCGGGHARPSKPGSVP